MAAAGVAVRLFLGLFIATFLLCSRAVDVASSRAVSSALNGAASKRSKQDGDNQTLVRVHIKQAPDPQFPVRPPAPPPQPPARTHPSVRLEPYAGGAVTQSAQLVPSVMQSCSQPPCCGASPCSSQFTPPQTCGAPPCCGTSPCSSLYGSSQQPVPSWMANSPVPQYPSAPLTNYPMVQEYSRTVPGAPLVQPRTLDYTSNPQPLRVETEAASITMPVTPNVGWEGDRRVGIYSLETSPSVRIVGEDACGCPAGVDPCNDPCNKPETPRDKIENKLDAIKSQIVEDAEKIKDQNLWIKQVKHIVQHYNAKISAVKKDNNGLQSEVKRLFALKKHYEDLLLQFELDQDHFKKVEQWHSPDEIVVQQVADHQMPNTKLNCVEADSCDTPAGI